MIKCFDVVNGTYLIGVMVLMMIENEGKIMKKIIFILMIKYMSFWKIVLLMISY
jgi:hypothetical protein